MNGRVEGLRETIRSLERFGVEASDLKNTFNKVGNLVVNHARPRTPTATGALAASIRASKTKNKAIVRAGGGRAKYAPYVHYGTKYMEPRPFLWDAVNEKRPEAIQLMETELNQLIRALGLD